MRIVFNILNNHLNRGINTFRSPRNYPLNEYKSDFILPIILFIILQIAYRGFMPETAPVKEKAIEMQKAFLRAHYEILIRENKISVRQSEEEINASLKSDNSGLWGKTAWLAGELIIKTFFTLGLLCLINHLVLKGVFKFSFPLKKLFAEFGIAYYIFIAETILMFLIVFAAGKMPLGINAAEFTEVNRISPAGFILGRINPFLLYFYWHLGCRISFAAGLKKSISGFMIAGGTGLLLSIILYYSLKGTSLITLLY